MDLDIQSLQKEVDRLKVVCDVYSNVCAEYEKELAGLRLQLKENAKENHDGTSNAR